MEASTLYMLIVASVRQSGAVPAVTHDTVTARLQTFAREASPALYVLLSKFDAYTGCPVLLNTSFSVTGEPIVETPGAAVAVAAFAYMNLNHLVVDGRHLLSKNGAQPDRF